MTNEQNQIESLGPAERIIQTLIGLTDHMVHNRPGIVSPAPRSPVGVTWQPCTWVEKEDGMKEVAIRVKGGKDRIVGMMNGTGEVKSGGAVVGEYRKPSDNNKLFPEVVTYMYKQVADVWQMDNAFAAHWASYAFNQDNRDLKTVLAAFMLVQSRSGQPVKDKGEVLFFDDDYRDVGEAMFLVRGRGHRQLEPKIILRVGDVLKMPEVVKINHDLGFGMSKKAAMGRYTKAVTKWLRYREQNPKMLQGLVESGQGSVVRDLARRVNYKPISSDFFRVLGWKQTGNIHRKIGIGETVDKLSLNGLTETEICQTIVEKKLDYKRLVGLLPQGQEVTRAIMAAVIDSKGVSERDMIILTPTLEALGLLTVEPYKSLWESATAKAKDQRAANVMRNVKSKQAKEGLEQAVDNATVNALEDVTKSLRVYCMVDKSASMEGALNTAVDYLTKFLGGFPLDRLHVSVFNTTGTAIDIKGQQRAAVAHAFTGHRASGGTSYSAGLHAIQHFRPQDDEDTLFFFVGDQAGENSAAFARFIEQTGLNPVAFGFLYVRGGMNLRGDTVEAAAGHLGIPCFELSENMFTDDDPYAVTRIIRDLIAATPVGKRAAAPKRKTLVEQILETDLLALPEWAA